MYDDVPEYVVDLSKNLRQNATKAESMLWKYLRNRRLINLKFRRQHPIGRYIADFYCNEIKLVIEIDGDIHKHKDVKEYDRIREEELASRQINVIRFTNEEIISNINNIINRLSNLSPLSSEERGRG